MHSIFEQVGGGPLEKLAEQHVFDFLELDTAHYRKTSGSPDKLRDVEVVATEVSEAWGNKLLQGLVHDENCFAAGGVGVHAGVFCNGFDLLQFGKAILNHTFDTQTMDAFSTRMSAPQGCSRTMGWDTPTPPDSSVGQHFSAHSIGHLGFTGTSLWIDLDAKLVAVLLTNRVHPTRNNEKIKPLRQSFHNTLREDLGF